MHCSLTVTVTVLSGFVFSLVDQNNALQPDCDCHCVIGFVFSLVDQNNALQPDCDCDCYQG